MVAAEPSTRDSGTAGPAAVVPLVAAGLSHAYGSDRVLDRVDLTLGAGEVLALLGPNGAGKSTLLRLLAGLQSPQAGSVVWWGLPATTAPVHVRVGTAVVAHRSFLFEDLTAVENLIYYARLLGLDRPEARARRVIADEGLGLFADRPVSTFSRGMTQRLAICRAWLGAPGLVFADEVETGLDPEAAVRLRARIAAVRSDGGAAIIVAHDHPAALLAADRYAILAGGQLADGGASAPWRNRPEEFAAHYRAVVARGRRRRRASGSTAGGAVTAVPGGAALIAARDAGAVTAPVPGGAVNAPRDGRAVIVSRDGAAVTAVHDGAAMAAPGDGGKVTAPRDGGAVIAPRDSAVMPAAGDRGAVIAPRDGATVMAARDGAAMAAPRDGGAVGPPVPCGGGSPGGGAPATRGEPVAPAHPVSGAVASATTGGAATAAGPGGARTAGPGAAAVVGAVVRRDALLWLRGRDRLGALLAFGLLEALVFGFALDPTTQDLKPVFAGVLWTALLFAALPAFGRSFQDEWSNDALLGYRAAGADPAVLFYAKCLGHLGAFGAAMLVLVPAFFALLQVAGGPGTWPAVGALALGAVAFVPAASLTAAVVSRALGPRGGALLSLIALPLLSPGILGTVRAAGDYLASAPGLAAPWMWMLAAYAVLFWALPYVLFPVVAEA